MGQFKLLLAELGTHLRRHRNDTKEPIDPDQRLAEVKQYYFSISVSSYTQYQCNFKLQVQLLPNAVVKLVRSVYFHEMKRKKKSQA